MFSTMFSQSMMGRYVSELIAYEKNLFIFLFKSVKKLGFTGIYIISNYSWTYQGTLYYFVKFHTSKDMKSDVSYTTELFIYSGLKHMALNGASRKFSLLNAS